jgi:hypothetical protein
MSAKLKFWIAGVLMAAIGLILARLISPLYSSNAIIQLSIFLVGVIIAMAGMGLILVGIRK